jgi:hypothetical protein
VAPHHLVLVELERALRPGKHHGSQLPGCALVVRSKAVSCEMGPSAGHGVAQGPCYTAHNITDMPGCRPGWQPPPGRPRSRPTTPQTPMIAGPAFAPPEAWFLTSVQAREPTKRGRALQPLQPFGAGEISHLS